MSTLDVVSWSFWELEQSSVFLCIAKPFVTYKEWCKSCQLQQVVLFQKNKYRPQLSLTFNRLNLRNKVETYAFRN